MQTQQQKPFHYCKASLAFGIACLPACLPCLACLLVCLVIVISSPIVQNRNQEKNNL
jgi:hypothetical protein